MPLRTSIHDCLKADSRVTDLIGAGDACRHYPAQAPQSVAFPFVVSFEIYGQGISTHGLPNDPEDSMDESQLQFSCYAHTAEGATALRSAIRAALLEDTDDVLSTARIVVTAPETRETYEEDLALYCAQLDLTFFHNPNT